MDSRPQPGAFSRVVKRVARNSNIVFAPQCGWLSWALCLHHYFEDPTAWNIISGKGLKKKQRSSESEWEKWVCNIGKTICLPQARAAFLSSNGRLELCGFAILGNVKIKDTFEIGSLGHQKQKRFVHGVVICWIN